MNKTRKLGAPNENPTALKEFTIRKGSQGWWRVVNNKWEAIKVKTRKKSGKISKWNEGNGVIMIRYNTDKKCDLISSNDCFIPYLEDSGWVFGSTSYPSKLNYVYNLEYIGPLENMKVFKNKLDKHYKSYKKKGYITNYTLTALPLTERDKLF
jgi:hypothetical protein